MRRLYLRISVLLLTFVVLIIETSAQIPQTKLDLVQHEVLLKTLFVSIQVGQDDALRKENNDEIRKVFRSILNDRRTFSYPFDSLKQLGKIYSSDSALRIYSWMLPVNNGYKHFGYVQYVKKNDKVVVYELNDRSDEIVEPEKQLLNDGNWYGAIYYKILPAASKKSKMYTLFGFDANNMLSNKKVIETISIEGDDKLVFGKLIFKTEKKILNRIIFEYSARSVMMLKYDDRYDMIVHDHLSPEKLLYKGKFMFYVPDLSYDGWMYDKGVWNMMQDVDLRNPKK